MTSKRLLLTAVAAVALVAGCSDVRETILPSKKAPDEFAVYQRAPLSVPPEFQLRAPAPGEERPQDVNPRDEAQQAITGSGSGGRQPAAGEITPGTEALLRNANALDVDPSIRATVNRETTMLAEESKTFTDRLMFWNASSDPAAVVDPGAEAKRIQQNQALGDPITRGDTPTIEKKRKGLLEDLF